MLLRRQFLILVGLFINGLSGFTPLPPVVFSPADYIFLVAEESGTGTVIGRVNTLTNEDLTLSFITTGTMFFINPNTEEISLLSSAPDFETTPSEPTYFQVSVSYTFKSIQFLLTSNITIFYTDKNDNSPLFSQPSYTFNFTSDLPPDSLVGFVSARDNDSNPCNFISYSVRSNISSSFISLTEEGGIYTKNNFTNRTYSFLVTATDSGMPARNTSVYIYFNVRLPRVPNDATSPILQQTNYLFQAEENINLYTDIGVVAANKDTSAVNGTFLYSANPGEMLFLFEVATGELSNKNAAFDFESGVTNYSFSVIAKLSFTGSSAVVSQDTSPVMVFLRNVNEHSPVVSIDPYGISLSADVAVGSVVGRIPSVSDLDGQNDFSYATNTNSPFSIDKAGYIHLSSQLDYPAVSSYQLSYTVRDTEMLGVVQSTSATLNLAITPPSVPPAKSFPTRNVEISHSCTGPDAHTFSFSWLPPTDNSNPTHYGVTISCFLSPTSQSNPSINVTQPMAVVTVSAAFDRFTYCSYEVRPYPVGPSASGQLIDFSFVTDNSTNFSVQATDQDILIVRVSNILVCLSDLHDNTPLFGTSITLNDTNGQVAQFDASYANHYDTQTRTLTVAGFSSSSTSLVADMVYSVSVNFPVQVFPLVYSRYNHTSVPIARKTDDLGWTQTCTPAFYTYTLSNTSVINQSCTSPSLLFLRAKTTNSYYQSLLPVSDPVSITVRDTSYGLTEWDSSQLVSVSLLQVACGGGDVSALYWNQVVQFLFLIQSGYSLSDTATTNSLSLTINPVSICSLEFTPDTNVNELTNAFQTSFSVTTDVFNETSATSHTCQVTADSLNQLIILQDAPNSQVTPSAEFTEMVPDNLTLQCNWSLTPGGIYNGRSVIAPLSTHRLSEIITPRNFTFQITPVDDNIVPLPLLVEYGAANGDTVLGKGQDVTSSQINLPHYFLIGSSYINTAYVSNKGLISFGNPFTSPYPEIFPGYSYLTKNAYIIAPFWANIDTTFLGEVSWQLHTSDATLLNTLSSLAKIYAGAANGFVSQSALVATWHKVRPYPAHGMVFYRCLLIGQEYMPSCTQHDTFQAVVLSDGGNNTHVLFSYNCRDFNWFKAPFSAAIGFNTGATFYNNHHLSTTNDVRMAICTNSNSYTIIGFKVSSTPGVVPTQSLAEMCRDRVAADRAISSLPTGNNLPPDFIIRSCPVDLLSVQIDSRFFLHSNSPACYTPVYPASDNQSILCCYATDSATFLPHLSTFLRYSPVAKIQYGMYEDGLFDICCASRLTCDAYYAVRPRVGIDGFNRTGFSGGFGDPHFLTFDETQFTFNGIGEFILTKSGSRFEAQIRTSKLDTINATYTSAVVLKSDTSEAVQVEINGTAIKVLRSGRVEVTNIPLYPLFWAENGYQLSFQSANQLIVVFSSGAAAKVWLYTGALFYAISLPNTFRDTLEGLLGNWNANSTDDLTTRGGMILNLDPLTPSQRDIATHNFGLSWNVGGGSLFQYPIGQSSATHTDTSFIPIYPSEVAALPNAASVCGSLRSCIYDFVVSGNTSLATNTLAFHNQLTQFQSISSESPPILTLRNGTETVRVVPGVWYYFLFEVFDPNSGFSVGVSSSLPDASISLSNNLTDFRKFYVLRFRLADTDMVFGVTVWARGRQQLSSGFSFIVNVCDCQFGSCSTFSLTREDYSLSYGKLACVCDTGYTGSTCSADFDACTTHYCYPEVLCVDLPPPSLTADCAMCPSGTTGNGRDCEDYNECIGDRGFLHNCSGTEECSNVIGGFECTCIAGYERNAEGYCGDTDECRQPLCHQTCVNTPGSYHCGCVAGMSLSGDGATCLPQVACVASECDTFSQVCSRIGTNDLCFCQNGFVANEMDSFSCLDLDECPSGICEHECTNQIGGFACDCRSGYRLAQNGRVCEDINECVSPDLCPDTFVCSNSIGSHKCVDPLNPFPANTTNPRFSLDVPAIIAGSSFALILSVSFLILIIFFCYKDGWRSWRRRSKRSDNTESGADSHFNIYHE